MTRATTTADRIAAERKAAARIERREARQEARAARFGIAWTD